MREAIGLLERLLGAAEAGGRMGSVIEILALQALAHQMQGDIPAARVPLARALTLAEPEDYARLFVDEGTPMAELLQELQRRGKMLGYVEKLLAAFPKELRMQNEELRKTTTSNSQFSILNSQLLVEPLSERELEVLRLLGTDLSGPEIARELMVSLNTMRTHTKNIYTKLGVNNRREAVRRARSLDLL
jgi:LuxR family maltose regulon positive regulatory protein